MIKALVRRSAFMLIACAIGIGIVPGRVHSQFVVVDPSNLAQNVTQVLRAAQQINNQRQQITYQLQALRKLPNPNWREIATLVNQLDGLMQQGEALGYSIQSLNKQFDLTFRGDQAAANNLQVP